MHTENIVERTKVFAMRLNELAQQYRAQREESKAESGSGVAKSSFKTFLSERVISVEQLVQLTFDEANPLSAQERSDLVQACKHLRFIGTLVGKESDQELSTVMAWHLGRINF